MKCLEYENKVNNEVDKENKCVAEEKEEYEIIDKIELNDKLKDISQKEKINKEHDKTYRQILSNKKDAVYIINEALKLKENKRIKEEEIEKYNSSFITKEYKEREADIVYKLKGEDIFFLIEHQSKVDYKMPYRMQEYKMEIIKSAIDVKRIRSKSYKMPEVIPIVIYTGKERWEVRKELNKVENERLKGINLIRYNLIDINKYEKERLIRSKEFIDKIFLIEKTKDIKEFERTVKEVSKSLEEEEDKDRMQEIIEGPIRWKLGEEKIQEIIKEMRGDENEMLGAVEMVIREYENARENGLRDGKTEGMKQGLKAGRKQGKIEGRKQGKIEGRKQAKLQMIEDMIKNGISDEQVKKISRISANELKIIKQRL